MATAKKTTAKKTAAPSNGSTPTPVPVQIDAEQLLNEYHARITKVVGEETASLALEAAMLALRLRALGQ